MNEKRYFLDRDSDGHWYLVPADKRKEWNNWMNIPEDDEASWDVPLFATVLGHHPALLTFTDPKEEE
jgi:hypothetical protein